MTILILGFESLILTHSQVQTHFKCCAFLMEELASSDGFFLVTLSLKVDAVADYSVLHRPYRRPALQELEVLFKEVLETFGGAPHWKKYITEGHALEGRIWF